MLKYIVFLGLSCFCHTLNPSHAAIIYVPDDWPSIQDAIDAASNGDTVIVRPGTYFENIDFIGKDITITSENGPDCTIINGKRAGSVVSFRSAEGTGSVLKGFTVTNGTGLQLFQYGFWFAHGGGIYCADSSPTITDNIIADNYLDGMCMNYGGGIYCTDSSPIITNNTITGNSASSFYGGVGGGIFCLESSPTITNNTILQNSANYAGGIYCYYYSSPTITNNTIAGNSAAYYGGGGGIYCKSYSSPTITNTVFWDNSALDGPEIYVGSTASPSTPSISYSDVEGGQSSCYVDTGCTLNWGSGMIDADPLWCDTGNGDFHLTLQSPCKDAGDNEASGLSTEDFEGDPRIALGTADMGADEYYYHLYHKGNVLPGSSIDVKVVGYPGGVVSLFLGSGIADPPFATQHGDFWLNWPPVWQGGVGVVPGTGVLVYSATVPSGWVTGDQHPLQSLVGPWGGGWTRLTNLHVVVVE